MYTHIPNRQPINSKLPRDALMTHPISQKPKTWLATDCTTLGRSISSGHSCWKATSQTSGRRRPEQLRLQGRHHRGRRLPAVHHRLQP